MEPTSDVEDSRSQAISELTIRKKGPLGDAQALARFIRDDVQATILRLQEKAEELEDYSCD